MGRLIYVEGGVGSGKSTYCIEVGRRLNYRVFQEPVDQEQLTRFYTEPSKYAYHLQNFLLHKRIGIQMLAACEALYSDQYDGAMVDRSLFGDAVFAKMHYEAGNISRLDWEAYQMSLTNMKFMIWPPTTLVYLDVQPEVALARIQGRMKEEDRNFEGGITLDYLKSLKRHYEEFIQDAKDGKFPWSHAMDVRYSDWNPATLSSTEWDAVAAALKEHRGR